MKEKTFQERIKIIGKENLGADYFKLSLACAKISRLAKPGQFVEIKTSDTDIPLLRRPLGVHRVKRNTFEVLCEIVGEGTELLSKKEPGGFLDVIGPLGNGFNYPASHKMGSDPILPSVPACILVAGGMGVAPLVFLAEKLVEGKRQKEKGKIVVLIGAKTKSHILCESDFKKLGLKVKIATDDGSRGFKGKVTELLNKVVTSRKSQAASIYACGPEPMLRAMAKLSSEYDIPAQVSLEAHMSCGFGACLGCVVNTQDGYKRVCKDGPVFRAADIIWGEE
jgi:dihydroorotate dehydrogenase electron transfer subunit